MSSNRARHIDRHAAEQLLAGRPVAGHATRPLAAALRAAAAPTHPEELAGERAMVAAFADAARLAAPVPETGRPSMLKSALAKILTVKAAVVLAAAGTGGVVLASTSGALPGPWTESPADPPAVTSTQHPAPGKPSDAGRPDAPGKGPSPSMAGLCRAYEAQVHENPGKALDSPAFTALVTAAGGKYDVDEYCDAVAAGRDPGRSGDRHGKPSDLPTPDKPGNGSGNDQGNGQGNDEGNDEGTGRGDDHPAPSGRPNAPDSPPATGTPTAVPHSGGPTPPVPGS
ncbi:hypothetical protein [Actinophytocola sp.]|uniref:hypothetical protein n=1 Tax=Actinophytocola sp. TaxID=1872138 RepID=UPI003D6C2F1C